MDNGEIEFKTSSPFLSASIKFNSKNDSINGIVKMPGNRSLSFLGLKGSEKVEPLGKKIITDNYLIASDSLGYAFPTLSADGSILVFSVYKNDFSNQKLMYITIKDGELSSAKVLPFSGNYSDRSPAFSHDGKLYFSSKRPIKADEDAKKDYDLWYVTYQNENNWSNPVHVQGINSEANDYQPSISKNGIYFTSDREGGLGDQDIYFAENQNDQFGIPINLGATINSSGAEMSAFVSLNDETMILSTSNSKIGIIGNDDLFLLEKSQNQWRIIKNLGDDVNSFANEYGAWLSPDGMWLYYTSDIVPMAKIYKTKLSM